MAMNKAEKAKMIELQDEIDLMKAMMPPLWPRPVQMTEEEKKASSINRSGTQPADQIVKPTGWDYNGHTGYISRIYTDGSAHLRCSDREEMDYAGLRRSSWSQSSGRVYRTRKEAYIAMLHEKYRKSSLDLLLVYRHIAEAEGEE